MIRDLYILSESRGKEAAGIAARLPGGLKVYKTAQRASQMIRTDGFNAILDDGLRALESGRPGIMIGHSRLVTNGSQTIHENNQPAIRSDAVAVHNGIVVNVASLWENHPDLTRETDLDTEVILALLGKIRQRDNVGPVEALRRVYSEIQGMTSLAITFSDMAALALSTNNGSLYFVAAEEAGFLVFASERFILDSVTRTSALSTSLASVSLRHLEPRRGLVIELGTSNFSHIHFNLDSGKDIEIAISDKLPIESMRPSEPRQVEANASTNVSFSIGRYREFERRYGECKRAIARLRRCRKCALPETIPYVDFDGHGICNYCRHYMPVAPRGRVDLENTLSNYRKSNGQPDCVVAFSGGRDSSYGLHYLVKELGMTPLAYTYDWGMVTDLARRNQSRMCGRLGIEHILVSANLATKRCNIRRNVTAWLRQPDLGMVPLFMAGDKQFFYYANLVGKQNNVGLVIFSENLLEKTYFKSGFCGIGPAFKGSNTYTLGIAAKLKLLRYYGTQFLTNPGYLNVSLADTFGAYLSYYAIPHNYLWLYRYLPWNENEIDRTLLGEYDWETATDTKTTWRIGDGTAPFYNYIYYVMAGFTENDSFRSNQIREGHIRRQEGIALIERDNAPRFESIQWYCDTIQIDMAQALKAIHDAPKLYQL